MLKHCKNYRSWLCRILGNSVMFIQTLILQPVRTYCQGCTLVPCASPIGCSCCAKATPFMFSHSGVLHPRAIIQPGIAIFVLSMIDILAFLKLVATEHSLWWFSALSNYRRNCIILALKELRILIKCNWSISVHKHHLVLALKKNKDLRTSYLSNLLGLGMAMQEFCIL